MPLIYVVAIAWLYVTVLMAATEPSLVGGLMTFLFYGLGPLALFLYLVRPRRAAPLRNRASSVPAGEHPDAPHARDAEQDERELLGGRREGAGNVLAAGLGTITPFCSCSAVPAFIGFVAAGVPVGVTLSFLIASPMVNEVAVVMLLGAFGPGVAALYVGLGLLVAIVAGFVLGRMGAERWVEPFVFETTLRGRPVAPGRGLSFDDRLEMGREEVTSIIRRIWPYLLVGIGLGAAIHGWLPTGFFAEVAGGGSVVAVPVAVVVGVPLYSNAAGVMPLIEALQDKGVAMGTLLALMMSVVALSLPEMILLRRVLKPRLIAMFAGVVATGILIVGYLFNIILG